MDRVITHSVALQIFDYFGKPTSEMVSIDLMARSLFYGADSRGDVRQYRMDNDVSDISERDKDEYIGKVPALGSGWRLHSEDNSPKDWQALPVFSPEGKSEQNLIQEAIAQYTSEKFAITQKPSASQTDADKERLRNIENMLESLNTFGYLEAVPGTQLFGDDVTCIYRPLSTANIPFAYRCRNILEYRRPITHWFRWYKPRPEQVNHYLQLDMGRSLRILFEGGDRVTLFRKNEERDPEEWDGADEARNLILAKKYLSETQSDQIRIEREGIETIQQAAKTAKRKLTNEEKTSVKRHQDRIKVIQQAVGLTEAEKAEVKELEDFLFRQIETMHFAESAQSFYERGFSLTCFDYGMGTASFLLNIGRNAFVFRDKDITRRRVWQWMWGSPTNKRDPDYNGEERLKISGSGGAFVYKQGYVKVNTVDELVSAPLDLGRALEAGVTPVNGIQSLNLPDGTGIEFEVKETLDIFSLLGIELVPRYQVIVRFISDGKVIPYLFRAAIQMTATPRPANVLAWDSAAHPEAVITFTSQVDSDRKGAIYQIVIKSKSGDLGLPANMRERVASLTIDSNPTVTGGVIADESSGPHKYVTKDDLTGARTEWTEWRYTLTDKGRPSRVTRFKSDVVFDGMFLNDAIRFCYRCAGYSNAEVAGIPAGQGIKLPTAAPGEKAAIRAVKGTRIEEYADSELVGRFGLGRKTWWDKNGIFNIGLPSARVLPGINYKGSLTATDPRRQYFDPIERALNTEKYFTFFRVEGADDAETGKPLSAEHKINEATDERFKGTDTRHIGYEKPAETVKDEALNEQTYVDIALQTKVALEGKPREQWTFRAPYADDILPGDVFQVNDEPWQLLKVSPSESLEDEQLMTVETP